MYLTSELLGDHKMHPDIGASVLFRTTLSPVAPAIADRFKRIIRARTVSGAEASTRIANGVLAELATLKKASGALRTQVDRSKAELVQAQRLASMPVVGNETAAITAFIEAITGLLRESPSVGRIERLRCWLPTSLGLDLVLIGKALDEHAAELAIQKDLRADLEALRKQLLEALRIAADPATLAALAKLKSKAKVTRAFTQERIASLENALTTAQTALGVLASEVAVFRGAIDE